MSFTHTLCCAVLVAVICAPGADLMSQSSKAKKKSTPVEQPASVKVVNETNTSSSAIEVTRKFNAYCSPLDIILSGLSDIDLGLDYKIAEFMTVGLGYRTKSGTSSAIINELPEETSLRAFRIQAEVYTSGQVYKSSFVVQIKHTWNTIVDERYGYSSTYAMNGLGALIGWRWFWTDPGEIGLNVSLLAGGSRLTFSEVGTNRATQEGIIPELRIDVGYAF